MICENCKIEHNGSYGSGRFCCSKCARCFSSKNKRKEINEKVSIKLSGRKLSEEHKKNISLELQNKLFSEEHKRNISLSKIGKVPNIPKPTSIKQISSRTAAKIIKRLNLGCSNCKWDKTIGDFHHIIPRNKGGTNDHDNLTYLCPNCHRLAHNQKIEKFINLKTQIGDKWLEYYYPEQAFIKAL